MNSLRLFPQQPLRLMGSRHHSQKASVQHSSPAAFSESPGKVRSSRQGEADVSNGDPAKVKAHEHRVDIGDEQCDLLGGEVFSGKLALDKRPKNPDVEDGEPTQDSVDARLTTKALSWGSHVLRLQDVISVSYCSGLRHFTVHAYPQIKRSWGLSCFLKPQRRQKDFRFLATTLEDARKWVTGFADQQCYVKLLPHPMETSNKHGPDEFSNDPFFEYHIKSKSTQRVLVILNPRSGHGRSSKVFHGKVEPIFKLAGFKMEIVNTTSAGHAKSLASTVDFSTCPDGIICVGGDGIVNEVCPQRSTGRSNQKEAISIPIGIIPAGSDNSLVWTVLGVKDPVSAAITIVKGGLTPTDVFAVEWIQTGVIHFGSTVSYFGFLSDAVGEVPEAVRPSPLLRRGVHKFLCLPKYTYELECLPTAAVAPNQERGWAAEDEEEEVTAANLFTDVMRGSYREGGGGVLQRASSLSSIDSIVTPGRVTGDLEMAGREPSDYVRGLDPKIKRLSLGRSNVVSLSATPNWPRTRSKSRGGAATMAAAAPPSSNDGRSSWRRRTTGRRSRRPCRTRGRCGTRSPSGTEKPSGSRSTNPSNSPRGPPSPQQMAEDDGDSVAAPPKKVEDEEERWVVRKGRFLGVLVCNHSCRTVQSLSSQVVAPHAEHDDNSLDLLLVHGSGRLRLLRFFLRLQCGTHLSLPYVEYLKVKSVRVKPVKGCHNGCGIDGELVRVNGEVICSLLPDQCRLIGRRSRGRV
ncbi:unnamed protein product [Spirodela intermedia]|uniref:DAGKc domain-containing protein n=1 Tax=Spirodela intermedia TaxID=51605 RepID=A0A7I8IF79_SPIIN|nr:unnamed protein product [Spirodela intermedia]CAA6656460.1 unnamed protein product [Spirodela intermedia]